MADPKSLLPQEEVTTFAGVEEKLGFWGACISLAVSMVGTGIVAFPYAFALCGYIVGPALLVLDCVLAHLSYKLLMQCSACEQVTSYAKLLTKLPKSWSYYTTISLWLLLVLACTAYSLIAADIIRSVVLSGSSHIPFLMQNHMLFGIILLCVFPIALLKTFKGLSAITTYCSSAMAAVVVLIAWKCAAIYVDDPPDQEHEATSKAKLSSVALAFPILANAMFGHMNACQIYAELQPRLKPEAHRVSRVACIGTLILYLAVGYVGYAGFGRSAKPDVVAEIAIYDGESGIVAIIQSLLGSFIALKMPLLIIPLRSLTLELIDPSMVASELPTGYHVLITGALLSCMYLAAVALPDLGMILAVIGAVCSIPLCFVIPARISCTILDPPPVVQCVSLAVFGIFASLISLYVISVG